MLYNKYIKFMWNKLKLISTAMGGTLIQTISHNFIATISWEVPPAYIYIY